MLHYLYELAFFFLGWKFIERVQTYDQLKKVAQFFLILIFILKANKWYFKHKYL